MPLDEDVLSPWGRPLEQLGDALHERSPDYGATVEEDERFLEPPTAEPKDQLLEQELAEPRRLTKAQRKSQEVLREELFRTGSDFKRTARSEIVGIDNVLGEIEEIIHWLQHSQEYGAFNSRLQPGVVFSGSPGTGKTLVSRWIATASNALFVNIRDFLHKGALFTDDDIRDLFRLARLAYAEEKRPVVLFWDEFENSAVERSADKTTPEQRSVVSQLTAELDGIHGKNEGILLIGCTNYLSAIDEALIRRGRMGVQIEFHSPDRQGKEKILGYYLSDMTCEPEIDMNTLSYFFPKANTAADIEEACVEAWRHAVRRSIDDGGLPSLAQQDLVKVFIKQLVGPPMTFTIPEDERMPIAIHECGHAISALTYGVPLRLITVQPGKRALGRVMVDDLKEYIGTIPETINYMKMVLGGAAGERTAGLDPMTGTTSDIARLNATAEFLINQLNAGERTGIFSMAALNRQAGYAMMTPQVSEASVIDADADLKELIEEVERQAYYALDRVGKENLWKIAAEVNERVTLTGNEFRELFIAVCEHEPELA